MKVVFIKSLPGTASSGDMKEVHDGYARNFLIPQKIAFPATTENLKRLEMKQKVKSAKKEKSRQTIMETLKKIHDKRFQIVKPANEEGKLFASLRVEDVLEKLKEKKYRIDAGVIEMAQKMKSVGLYDLPVVVEKEKIGEIHIEIVPEKGTH